MTCATWMVCILLGIGQPTWKANIIADEVCGTNLDKVLVIATWKHESRLVHQKTPNSTWDWGIAQLHCVPGGKVKACTRCDIRNLRCNIQGGVLLLLAKRKKCKKHPDFKICQPHWIQAYNGRSPGYANRVFKVYREIAPVARKCAGKVKTLVPVGKVVGVVSREGKNISKESVLREASSSHEID